jgi:tRNA threonylcarbamoyladenosine biosynthesis protein TsaB
MAAAGVSPAEIELFAVGLGPGSYSGLRIALAAVEGMALPSESRVYGLTTGEILAEQHGGQEERACVSVLGDARRGRLWTGRFVREAGRFVQDGDYSLMKVAELPARLGENDLLLSPDWHRLGTTLTALPLPPGTTVLEQRAIPDARVLARLAATRFRAGVPSPPLKPVYLHPPVFVEPRFPGA